jgi:hypothetical protein
MDGKVIFWGGDGKMKQTLEILPFRVQSLDVSPDGRYLIAISHRYLPTPRPGSSTALALANLPSTSSMHTWADANTSPVLHDEDWAFAHSETEDVVDLGGGSRTLRDERFQIHFYDMRQQEELGSIYMKDEMTSVSFSEDSRHVLINQRPNEAQMWDFVRQSLVQRYTGHHIHNFVIRSCFGGAEESFVVSGSEDGAVYLYHRKTGRLLERLKAHDKGSVNSVTWHPRLHNIFASCGDDGTVRLWGPGVDEGFGANFGDYELLQAMERNGSHEHQNGSHAIPSEILAPAENGYELLSGAPIRATNSGIQRSSDSVPYLATSQDLSDGAGPTPFPWATSPRTPTSPTSVSRQRQLQRQAARNATRDNSAATNRIQTARDGDEEAGHEYDDEEEEEEDEEEEEEEEEEEDEDAMEEGGD